MSAPIRKFYVRWNTAAIEQREVISETAKCVVVRITADIQRRESKHTTWDAWFDTWEQAHAALLERADRELASARRTLQIRQSFHGNVRGLKKPADVPSSPVEV